MQRTTEKKKTNHRRNFAQFVDDAYLILLRCEKLHMGPTPRRYAERAEIEGGQSHTSALTSSL